MKNFKFLIVALFAVLICANLTSCNKDDDEPDGNGKNYSLVGKWIDEDGYIYEFDKDHTFKVYDEYPYSYGYGTWKLSSSYLTLTYKGYMDYGHNDPDYAVESLKITWIDKDTFLYEEDGEAWLVRRY